MFEKIRSKGGYLRLTLSALVKQYVVRIPASKLSMRTPTRETTPRAQSNYDMKITAILQNKPPIIPSNPPPLHPKHAPQSRQPRNPQTQNIPRVGSDLVPTRISSLKFQMPRPMSPVLPSASAIYLPTNFQSTLQMPTRQKTYLKRSNDDYALKKSGAGRKKAHNQRSGSGTV